jgi:hypothetical protein
MEYICNTWKEPNIKLKNGKSTLEIGDEDIAFNEENEIVSKLGISVHDNPPSLIIIDEISKFTNLDLSLI